MMDTQTATLITSGEDIKVWDLRNFELTKQYNPHNSNLSCAIWTPNFEKIASASVSGDKIVLATPDLRWTQKDILIQQRQVTLNYSSDNRNLISGGTDGSVNIYDLMTEVVKQSIHFGEEPITSVLFMNDDECVVASNKIGDVYISRISQFQSFNRFHYTTPVQHIDKSLFQKNIFASAEYDGSISIWDVETGKLVGHQKKCHSTICRQLSFSPYNDMLMTSVGSGTGIVIHDTRIKVDIQVIDNQNDLYSVKMMHDGTSVVVGDSKGVVTTYDIRDITKPIMSLNAHKTPVTHLSCSHRTAEPHPSVNTLFSPCRYSLDARESMSSCNLMSSTQNNMDNDHFLQNSNLTNNISQLDRFDIVHERSLNTSGSKEIKELSAKMDLMMEGFSEFKKDINQKLNSIHFKISYKLTKMEDSISKSQLNNALLDKLSEDVAELQIENEALKCIY